MPAPPDEIGFAPLSEADAGKLSALHARCFAHGWSAADFARLAIETHCCGVVARRGDQAAGVAVAQLAAGEAEILTIAVAPEHRRAGCAAALLDRLMAELSKRGAAMLFLEVGVENRPAIGLYQKAGFTQAGRRPGYYRDPNGPQDALILRRPLSPLSFELPATAFP